MKEDLIITPTTLPPEKTKIDATQYDTDKSVNDHYLRVYADLLQGRTQDNLAIMELGVFKAGSLYMWRDYLPNSTIVGLDISPVEISDETGRIHFYQGEQQDAELLDRIQRESAPEGFDLIVDDASHVGEFTRLSFWHLYENHLRPGGIYVIEDWGCSYWKNYPDGRYYDPKPVKPSLRETFFKRLQNSSIAKVVPPLSRAASWGRYHLVRRRFPSHDYGMVGFVKQLVDECGIGDITHPEYGRGTPSTSRIASMTIQHGMVIIKKPMSHQ